MDRAVSLNEAEAFFASLRGGAMTTRSLRLVVLSNSPKS
jgi:hypothetical protein